VWSTYWKHSKIRLRYGRSAISRLTLPTLGPVVATVKPPGSVREISLTRVVVAV
jgi:hypothetical protein